MSSSPLSRAHLCHYLVTSCCNYNCSCITLTAGGCSPGGPCRFINVWLNEALAASPSWSLHLHLVQNYQNAWGLGQSLLPFSPQVTFSTPMALSHSFTLMTPTQVSPAQTSPLNSTHKYPRVCLLSPLTRGIDSSSALCLKENTSL